jgi:uncharacterized membrane protein (DUF106 family)
MNTDESAKLIALLEEIRAGQKLQIERQAEALELQRQQFAVFRDQAARAEKIQQKAEQLQDKGASLVGRARKALVFILLVVVVLIAYVSWILLRSHY